ncbi:UDP-N-acetylmuramoyl-L-alanyl-D-glutamate--2,6-diaminopimelate ligase [Desulfosarcina sp. OttesenSCG-928-A07]|nr:UDP-N-acetylmuramoyl-L-alanyl-D-glutamate--2,6-diaminopimelate ligase [Desulfosarcina sp. OttesenSCG-928-A07]
MKWSALIDGLTADRSPHLGKGGDTEITALCHNSQRVVPGAAFVAIEGFSADGHRFVSDAVERGAVAVVCQKPVQVPDHVAVVQVPDSRSALAFLACRFYGNPADELVLVGVTGTSGKTTITFLLESILKSAGIPVGVIGTINYRYGGKAFPNPVTTPESADLQAILRQMADSGISHVVMEVSSHALDLFRVKGCAFDLGIFTNLTHDHLDYHKNTEHYWNVKQKLFFRHLKPTDARHGQRAVVNTDDIHGKELAGRLGNAAWRVSAKGNGDIRPVTITCDLDGIRGQISTPLGTVEVETKLVGDFNLENILCAIGAGLLLSIPRETLAVGIDSTPCVPGRLERISDTGGRFVFVDYAHKPDALAKVIQALRQMNQGRLITVFGCGGNRDAKKRPEMGEIAANGSDLVIITSDNPRFEDPMAIISAIETGVQRVCHRRWDPAATDEKWTGPAYGIEPNRHAAIFAALSAAEAGDTVLIAGKGHETYQIIGNQSLHFDDRDVAREILARLAECDTCIL